jgi:NADH-quinone oxidoreductase subunit M
MAMVVAGKLGLYSLIRFHVGLFPVQAHQAAPWMDRPRRHRHPLRRTAGPRPKRLLEAARLRHHQQPQLLHPRHLRIHPSGLDGSVFQTLNEGIIGAALFVLLGVLYDRFGTSQISQYGGLAKKTPALATLFVITSLAMIGLPMLNGFIGEFLVLSSTFTGVSRSWAAAATLGVILSAAYMLTLVQKVFYGPQSNFITSNPAFDLNGREKLNLWPLAILMLIMGIAPNLWLTGIEPALVPASQGARIKYIDILEAPSSIPPEIKATFTGGQK